MRSIRNIKVYKSNRKRECWCCGKYIEKEEQYIRREVRYDKTIISQYFHIDRPCSEASQLQP